MKTRDYFLPHTSGMRNLHPTSFLSRCLALTGAAVLAGSLFAQGNGGSAPGKGGLPEDWSHQHVVFSPPRSPQAAAAIQKDPRYLLQLLRRQHGGGAPPPVGPKELGTRDAKTTPPPTGDWNVSMGRTGSRVTPTMFPAKFSFKIGDTPSCNDFVVFADDQPALARASGAIVLGPQLADSDSITIAGSPARTYTFRTSNPLSADGDVHIVLSGGNIDQDATGNNLVAAINHTGTPGTDYGSATTINVDVSATGRGGGGTTGIVNLTARAPGTSGNSITITKPSSVHKNHIDLGPTISGDPDIVTLTGGGSMAQSTIFAINNLYAGGSDVAASATGTFTTTAPTAGTATITNGANSITLTENIATRATATGTFSGNVRNSGSVTITNGGNQVILTPSATPPHSTGTFSSGFCAATDAGLTTSSQSVTITRGVISVTVKTNATASTGTVSWNSGGPNATDTSTVAIKGGFTQTTQTYTFRSSLSGGTSNQVLIGDTTTHTAANLQAAINNNSSQCGNTVSGVCFRNVTTNNNVSATVTGSTTNLTAKCVGTANNITVTLGGTTNATSTNSAGTDGSNSSTTFALSGTDLATDAGNLGSAIHLNAGTVGVDSTTANSNPITVTATTPGTDITFTVANTFSTGFAWSPTGTVSNGTNITGSAGCSGAGPTFTGTFAISNTNSTEASSLVTALNACPTAAGITAAQGANTSQVIVTARTPGSAGNSITVNESLDNFVWSNGINQSPPAVNLSGGTNDDTGTNFSVAPSTVTTADLSYDAANLAAAIARNGGTVGVTATSSGAVVTVTATSFGPAGNLITLSENMNNFTWASSNLQGGNSAGGCGESPTVTWAYNASGSPPAAGGITTSPALSLDGTKVAFVENVFSGAVLHVLTWAAGPGQGSVASPATPSSVVNLTYSSAGNTYSSPFPRYASDFDPGGDVIYVGDDDGKLWKITGVFNGTPTLAGLPWPITVNPGHKLTGPVFDFTSKNIFVADDSGRLSFVHEVGSTPGTCTPQPCLDSATITSLTNVTDPPIVDSQAGKVFVFSGSNGTNAVVVQANIDLTGQVALNVGQASTTQVHAGTFDNDYYLNGPSSAHGHLYVCGKASGNSSPVLYRVGFADGGGMNTSTIAGPLALTTATTANECSPLSEIFNPNQAGGIDWLFVGVPASCAFSGSTTGCVMAFNITSAFPTTAVSTGAEAGGTSGIVVDNISTVGQASSFYYSTLSDDAKCGSGGCAVKRTQAGLQ